MDIRVTVGDVVHNFEEFEHLLSPHEQQVARAVVIDQDREDRLVFTLLESGDFSNTEYACILRTTAGHWRWAKALAFFINA